MKFALLATLCVASVLATPVSAQTRIKTKTPAKPPVNETRGQGQMQSVNGQFGTIYTLQDNFNFEILSSRYTMEEPLDYNGNQPGPEGKLLVIRYAVKNANPKEAGFAAGDLFTAVDDKGHLYNSNVSTLQSRHGALQNFLRLNPGQGAGQPTLNDPLEANIVLPADARIIKIFVNRGRAGKAEKIIRYYVAGATKAEAGENGDPKNSISPLPVDVHDPSDKTGAVALKAGKGEIGKVEPSNLMRFKVNTVTASTTETLNGKTPPVGKQFVIVSVTITTLLAKGYGNFAWPGGGGAFAEIQDTDGEKYPADGGARKPSQDERTDRAVKAGEEYTYRVFFAVPKDAALKTLTFGGEKGRKWTYDISGVK